MIQNQIQEYVLKKETKKRGTTDTNVSKLIDIKNLFDSPSRQTVVVECFESYVIERTFFYSLIRHR